MKPFVDEEGEICCGECGHPTDYNQPCPGCGAFDDGESEDTQ